MVHCSAFLHAFP
ncbi:hypothetical protein Zm00014a_009050 [Zea mays]|uniref:Uncharacterized protein n=1 Tax=Zea mays TaxID=4577 RepID=A0A3L6F4W3_MAIZE|nr:hypothetical protein Zm00014a_009050 [Zea mays]